MKKKLEKIHTFVWEGINKQGLRVRGKSSGIHSEVIYSELKRQEINPIKIRKKITLFSIKRIKFEDIVFFTRHLATLLTSGIPLVPALDIIAKGQLKLCCQELIQTVKSNVICGTPFSESLSRHPKYFNELFCNLINAGELSGTLDIMLNRLADHMEKLAILKKRIRKAMYYPVTVLGISFFVATALLIFIIPQFEKLFSSFGAQLPLFTQLIIGLSRKLQQHLIIISLMVSVLIGCYFPFRKYSRTFQTIIDAMVLRLPIFGSLISKAILARVTRTLATMISVGIPILDALEHAATVANNSIYYQALLQIRQLVARGQQMHSAMAVFKVFPNMTIQMVAVGEESGTMDIMLSKIASFYEEDVDNLVNNLSTLLEPLIIVILSVIIGSFVLAMYLPIFRLGSIV